MKKIILIIIVLSFNLLIAQNDSLKYWSSIEKLNISDFKKDAIGNEKMTARTVCMLDIIYIENSNRINVISVFNKNESYIIKESKYLLKHEQLHFDILELYARKIRKELMAYYKSTVNINRDKVYQIYNDYIKKYRECDMMYDKETNHSLNKKEQEKWNEKIKLDIKNLKNYNMENYEKLIYSNSSN